MFYLEPSLMTLEINGFQGLSGPLASLYSTLRNPNNPQPHTVQLHVLQAPTLKKVHNRNLYNFFPESDSSLYWYKAKIFIETVATFLESTL